VQRASSWNGVKPGSVMSSTITAFLSSVTSSAWTVPTSTPATFTSSPATTNDALSKIARTL
jgi:hypothetical protein